MTQSEQEIILPDIPKTKWILLFFLVWLILGAVPICLVFFGNNIFSLASKDEVGIAGTIGDAFGFVNSFFSTAALLFIIWSIKLQRQEVSLSQKEWRENTQSQKEQALLMKEASYLTAINHIYQHFGVTYGTTDSTGILNSIAEGHRKWAIRETFKTIDDSFNQFGLDLVNRDIERLKVLLKSPSQDKTYLSEVGTLIASLAMDKRISAEHKQMLWRLYEIFIRPSGSTHITQGSFGEFEDACKNFTA